MVGVGWLVPVCRFGCEEDLEARKPTVGGCSRPALTRQRRRWVAREMGEISRLISAQGQVAEITYRWCGSIRSGSPGGEERWMGEQEEVRFRDGVLAWSGLARKNKALPLPAGLLSRAGQRQFRRLLDCPLPATDYD